VIAEITSPDHVPNMSIKPDSLLPRDISDAMKNEAVGYRLALLRRALGLSPSEMADHLGIERTYWSRYEKGRQGLSPSVAALLVVRFGVSLDFLVLGRWDRVPLDLAEKMRKLPSE
jgi:transcriptional regulator with XRE-family HTH domain